MTLTPICAHDCLITCATWATIVSPLGTTTFALKPFGTLDAAISDLALSMS